MDKQKYKTKLPAYIYNICWNKATEPPFSGEYDKHFTPGIYSCICCANKLFTSAAKYDSGSGWPSFWETATAKAIISERDESYNIKCGNCGAHLGHMFNDGPKPTNQRYCINSASLSFTAYK